MNLLLPAARTPKDRIQNRLFFFAACFVILAAAALTLSSAVRYNTWQVAYRWQHWIGVAVWLVGFTAVHRQVARRVPERDPYILPVAALLSGWGLLVIWRLDEGFGLRQTIWLALGLAALWLLLRVPRIIALLRRYKYIWLFLGLGLTALTFVLGTYPGGSGPRLWLDMGGIYLQPSEPLKLLLIVYLAAYLADRVPFGFGLLQILTPTLVMIGTALAILVTQRDLGTATLFILLYAALLYIATGRKRVLLISALILIVAGVAGYRLFDVIHLRLDTWLNPWADPAGTSFQVVQSLISSAAGGLFGAGFGLGSPGVVPVAHSDFIFSAISEEFGLLGAVVIFLLLALMASRGLAAAVHARSNFQRYLAFGLTFYLVSQSLIIIGGNLGVFPLTGVTLPFVSYGGSSLATSLISVFLLLLVSNRGEEELSTIPSSRPYLLAGAGLMGATAVLALVSGWWSMVRSSDLLARPDNPRWSIIQRYVARGSILDHNNQPLAQTTGAPGDLQRLVTLPSMGSIIGYTHPLYGQAGLEASLDPYLRGLQGTPTSSILLYQLLYAQTPPGNDVRLSIDLPLQRLSDQLLTGHTGALVLLNAHSGEILAMSSMPAFDPNQLDQLWDYWMKNERSVFLNRATQGLYPPGAAMGPFLLAQAVAQGRLTPAPGVLTAYLNGATWNCALDTPDKTSWSTAIMNGCPGASLILGSVLQTGTINRLYSGLGFEQAPALPLPVAQAIPLLTSSPDNAALGQSNVSVSPLQMALAAAALSNEGNLPSPRLATAVRTPNQGWVSLPNEATQEPVLTGATQAALTLEMSNLPAWGITATAHTSGKLFTWFIGGSLPGWQGAPIALAVILEEENPAAALRIGQSIFQSVLQP